MRSLKRVWAAVAVGVSLVAAGSPTIATAEVEFGLVDAEPSLTALTEVVTPHDVGTVKLRVEFTSTVETPIAADVETLVEFPLAWAVEGSAPTGCVPEGRSATCTATGMTPGSAVEWTIDARVPADVESVSVVTADIQTVTPYDPELGPDEGRLVTLENQENNHAEVSLGRNEDHVAEGETKELNGPGGSKIKFFVPFNSTKGKRGVVFEFLEVYESPAGSDCGGQVCAGGFAFSFAKTDMFAADDPNNALQVEFVTSPKVVASVPGDDDDDDDDGSDFGDDDDDGGPVGCRAVSAKCMPLFFSPENPDGQPKDYERAPLCIGAPASGRRAGSGKIGGGSPLCVNKRDKDAAERWIFDVRQLTGDPIYDVPIGPPPLF